MKLHFDEILFSPTADCNLRCSHCDTVKSGRTLSREAAVRFLSGCKKIGVKKAGFTGGEPFLALDFLCAVTEKAVTEGMLFGRIMTNGVWYKDAKELKSAMEKLYRAGYDGDICISVDAFHEQDLRKIALFIETAANIWKRPDIVSIAYTAGAKDRMTKYKIERLKGMIRRMRGQAPFIKIYKINLSAVGRASKMRDPWDGKWFKEDFCKGPGNVFFVMPDGRVRPCCGYASEKAEDLYIGNIMHDSPERIIMNANKNRYVKGVFGNGLSRIRRRLQKLNVKFPGKTTDHCYFCDYILKKVPKAILAKALCVLLPLILLASYSEAEVLKMAKERKALNAKVLRKIPLPRGYHEGLFSDGRDMWVANGRKGPVWVVDMVSGQVKSEIKPVGGFTEAITLGPDGRIFVTDWEEKKLYRVRVEDGKMTEEASVSFGSAHPAGMVWNGRSFFVITWTRGLGTKFDIAEVSADLKMIRKVRIRNIEEPSMMAFDGEFLWITSWYSQHVYKVDLKSWRIVASFKSPLNLTTGILYDGKYFWITGTYSDLYQLEVVNADTAKEGSLVQIKVTSPAFNEGGMIPTKYTCDGDDMSPPLNWSGIPSGTKTIALISDDPDAPMGTWVHWVLFNLPSDTKGLPEGMPADKVLASGAKQGVNDSRQIGYGGPCPPSGTHRYYFKVYALDSKLSLEPGASKKALLKAMEGHILLEGQIMGRYKR